MKLEVIAKDLTDIEMINQSNADRIEFCTNLEVGGLTPSYNDITQAGKISRLPVNVMVRPHGRDFIYTAAEFDQMLEDVKFIADSQVSGIVVGILTPDAEIDVERMKQIMALKKDKTVTFHRAFQEVKNQKASLQVLHDLGINTVLTSGGDKIVDSLTILNELKTQNLVTILAGGGVDETNIEAVKKVVNEVHVGTAARETKSWSSPISLAKIAELKAKLN